VRRGRALALLALLLLMPSEQARCEETLPPPGDPAWRPLTFPKIDRHTRYEVVEVEGEPSFRADADCSASGMVLPLEGVDLSRTPRLSWRWRVERRLEIEDERSKASDDFAARVYVMFRFDSERASLWQRLQRRIAERIYGAEIPGDAISYVWTSGVARGQHWVNPYAEDAHMVALRSGEDVGWQHEIVDLTEDHARLTGKPRVPVLALAIMSDSDNSCQQATAYFADFQLLKAREDPPRFREGQEGDRGN
jgi:hypothetical protein